MSILSYDIAGDQIDGARDYQEDAFLITHLSSDGEDQQALIVVADGMGGHAAGNVASNMAVQAFNKHASSNHPIEDPTRIPDILRTGIHKANDAISETVKETAALTGMGCTMVSALLADGKLWWASVGDSHLYLVRDNQLTKLNADHSYGGFLDRMAEGGDHIEINPSLSRNMLMSALVGEQITAVDVSIDPFILQPNDSLFIASDGLDTLAHGEIIQQSSESDGAKQTSAAILKAVMDAGLPRQDNTTVVNVRTSLASTQTGVAAYDYSSDDSDESKGGTGKVTAMLVVLIAVAAGFSLTQSNAPQLVAVVTDLFSTQPGKPQPATTTAENDTSPEEVPPEVAATVPETADSAEPAKATETPAVVKPAVQKAHIVKPFSDKLKNGKRGPTMLPVPAGEFQMGSSGLAAQPNERPQHTVTLKAFAISRHEITYAEYEAFAKATGKSAPQRSGVNPQTYPVANVSWQDAQSYTAWLSRQSGKRYSLPTEAQWEYAGRAGTTSEYWWGRDIGDGNAHCFGCGSPFGDIRKAAPVGRFAASPWGLKDTSGNVAEWTLDCYNENYNGAPADGSVWQDGDCSKRIVRGGSFSNAGEGSTSTRRKDYSANSRLSHIGFRVVRKE